MSPADVYNSMLAGICLCQGKFVILWTTMCHNGERVAYRDPL